MSGRGRSTAEWVTFAVASAILLSLVALILLQIPSGGSPPEPSARITGPPEERGGSWFVVVDVENSGDGAAENVQVLAALEIDDRTEEGDQTIDFLSGGETESIEFVFDDDPGEGALTVRVTGYSVP